jgi:hypothetical protein
MKELYKEGFEKYPLGYVIGQNIFFLVYFGIGFVGMLPLQIRGFPIISICYALFLVIMLLFVLRKHICTNCYYYGKLCNTGWGRLALMFEKESGNYELGVKLANVTWMLATLIPIIGIAITLISSFSTFRLTLLVLFLFLTPINFIIHKKSCKKCKMRHICPLSMTKGNL